MPLQLTTPKSTGDLDSQATSYTQVRILGVEWDANRILIKCQYGNTVDGVWIGGIERKFPHKIAGDEYAAFLTANAATYQAAKTSLYNQLVAAGKVGAGDVV